MPIKCTGLRLYITILYEPLIQLGMITTSELTDLPDFDFENGNIEPNPIRLSDVFEFIIESSEETNRRIIEFASSRSGLCSIQQASEHLNIKPPTYCKNPKYEKFYFVGKTYVIKKIKICTKQRERD